MDVSRESESCPRIFSSGAIFSSTSEYLTCALTQAASGAAATETRRMFLCSNSSSFSLRIFRTISRFFAVTTCASKLMISSFTPRDPRNFFCPAQLVSGLFIRSSTASRTARIPSGGVRSDLISLMLSDLIWPTAARAESIKGCTSLSSSSMPAFWTLRSFSSVLVFSLRLSTSFLRSLAADMLTVMRDNASSASRCFSARSVCCSAACPESSATAAAASSSLERPAVRWFLDATCSSRLLAKMRRYWSTNVTYCRGVPPTARCIAHICSTTSASSSASLASNASCSRVRGTARMPTSLHPSIQCTEHLVNSAGFASVRAAHSASAGSMLSAMCSPDLARGEELERAQHRALRHHLLLERSEHLLQLGVREQAGNLAAGEQRVHRLQNAGRHELVVLQVQKRLFVLQANLREHAFSDPRGTRGRRSEGHLR